MLYQDSMINAIYCIAVCGITLALEAEEDPRFSMFFAKVSFRRLIAAELAGYYVL
jgi:hypothetical protein